MGKCWAFYPIAGTRLAWIPCMRKAVEGERYCRRHGDAITGAVLGATVHAEEVGKASGRNGSVGVRRGAQETKRKKRREEKGSRGSGEMVARRWKSPVDDPLAGRLRVAGGSERGRGARVLECAR